MLRRVSIPFSGCQFLSNTVLSYLRVDTKYASHSGDRGGWFSSSTWHIKAGIREMIMNLKIATVIVQYKTGVKQLMSIATPK